MRPVDKSNNNLPDGSIKKYQRHGDAKPDLINNIGPYCSYCEVWGTHSHLEVEHILYFDGYSVHRTDWNNFLLSCKNCNTIKSTKDVNAIAVYLPHQTNTFKIVKIIDGGVIKVNPLLEEPARIKAQQTIELTGQDRVPGHPNYSRKDNRWELRRTSWELAKRYLVKYEDRTISIDDIVLFASQRGFWSIWMTVFSAYPDVLNQFIDSKAFAGTSRLCFNENGEAINRNGLEI